MNPCAVFHHHGSCAASSGVDAYARRGRGRAAPCVLWSVATQKANGSKQPAQHTQNIALRTRDRTQEGNKAAAYPSEFSFAAFSFLFCVAKSAKPNECLLWSCSCRVWVHLPGTPRDTPRSRLLPRPAFSAASCPPAVRPPKSLPHFTVAGAGLQRHVGVWTFGCSKLRYCPPLSLSLYLPP